MIDLETRIAGLEMAIGALGIVLSEDDPGAMAEVRSSLHELQRIGLRGAEASAALTLLPQH